jgi:Na+/proline symporter
MIGLDQDLMQKNLTCKDYNEARKNMLFFSFIMLFVNILFLCLGSLLYMYMDTFHIALNFKDTDDMYPMLALEHFGNVTAICFLLGITASSYASSDSALASLTTAFCIDFLNFSQKNEQQKKTQKLWVHIGFSILFFFVILLYRAYSNKSVIDALFTIAGYTYGPLLGLFSFGILTKKQVNDKLIPYFALLSPILTYGFFYLIEKELKLYNFSFELLVINALIMMTCMTLASVKKEPSV